MVADRRYGSGHSVEPLLYDADREALRCDDERKQQRLDEHSDLAAAPPPLLRVHTRARDCDAAARTRQV